MLFLDVPTLKLRIIFIFIIYLFFLPTDQPTQNINQLSRLTVQQKIKLPLPNNIAKDFQELTNAPKPIPISMKCALVNLDKMLFRTKSIFLNLKQNKMILGKTIYINRNKMFNSIQTFIRITIVCIFWKTINC